MERTSFSDGEGKRTRVAKLFRNGKNQAVRLPRDYEIQSDEVFIEKKGVKIILTPKPRTWEAYLASAHRLKEDFPDDIDDLPLESRENF